MDFNTTIDIILKDLREVREIIDDLKNYPGLPMLQVELAKAKCRSAEEVIALLKTLNKSAPEKVTSPVIVPSNETDNEKNPQPSKVESLIEITEEEEIETKKPEVIEIPEKKIIEQTQSEDKKIPSATFADKFTGSSGTISDRFGSGKKGEDLASVIKRNKPLENLADAIGISDKFLFIREIFKGNQPDYEQAIEKLNRAGNMPDAMAIIMSYTGENEESEVVQQLLEIVKRKIPSDG
jgi:hypothetical protein